MIRLFDTSFKFLSRFKTTLIEIIGHSEQAKLSVDIKNSPILSTPIPNNSEVAMKTRKPSPENQPENLIEQQKNFSRQDLSNQPKPTPSETHQQREGQPLPREARPQQSAINHTATPTPPIIQHTNTVESQPELKRLIQHRAYEIWQNENCPHGRDRQHWAQAETEIVERLHRKEVHITPEECNRCAAPLKPLNGLELS